METNKQKSRAGRKKIADKKVVIQLLVKKSIIVGEDNLDMDEKSEEYIALRDKFRGTVYETIEFLHK